MSPTSKLDCSTPQTADRQRDASGVEQEIARISGMDVDALRLEWRRIFVSDPPAAFSKGLLARAISYRLQEQVLGGLNATTTRFLRSFLRDDAEPARQLKVGSVIVREHKGVSHEVMVLPGGFCWQSKTYDSLSTIAKKITGVSWNGPRFFGLRSKQEASTSSKEGAIRKRLLVETRGGQPSTEAPVPRIPPGAGRRSSVRSSGAGSSGGRP
jgi:hypothetical protein